MILMSRYKELGVKPVWALVKEWPDLLEYFPNFEETEHPDRSFMWALLSSMRPDACKQLLEDARKVRSSQAEESKDELIEINPNFLDNLLSIHVLAKSKTLIKFLKWIVKGRVAYLLKKKAPMKVKRSKQKEFPAKIWAAKENRKQRREKRGGLGSQLHESNMIVDNPDPRSFNWRSTSGNSCQVIDWRISYSFSICFV